MFKKIFFHFVGILSFFLLGFSFTSASVVINEIMYDLQGSDSIDGKSREWVELYNNGSSAVTLNSDWRFSDGSAHYMNDKNSFSIEPNGFIVLTGDKDTFLSEHSGFSGVVIDTSMSLSNTSGTLKILENEKEVDSVTYNSSQGGNGDGKTLQKISSSWKALNPTPGTLNEENNQISTVGLESTSGTNIYTIKTTKDTPILKTQILANDFGFIGVPVKFLAETIKYSTDKVYSGKYFFNFADGSSQEFNLNNFKSTEHTFYYEGNYKIILRYYEYPYSENSSAEDEFEIKIAPLKVLISNVGNEDDFFVEVKNNSTFDLDISDWFLEGLNKNFIFPQGTILEGESKIILSPKITGFSVLDKQNLKIKDRFGNSVFNYFSPVRIQNKIQVANSEKNFVKEKQNFSLSTKPEIIKEDTDLVIDDLENDSSSISEKDNEQTNFIYGLSLFLVLLSISIYAIYRLRRIGKRGEKKTGDDFEIIDE